MKLQLLNYYYEIGCLEFCLVFTEILVRQQKTRKNFRNQWFEGTFENEKLFSWLFFSFTTIKSNPQPFTVNSLLFNLCKCLITVEIPLSCCFTQLNFLVHEKTSKISSFFAVWQGFPWKYTEKKVLFRGKITGCQLTFPRIANVDSKHQIS